VRSKYLHGTQVDGTYLPGSEGADLSDAIGSPNCVEL
jgi:hypothetical protein